MLEESRMPPSFWAEATSTFLYVNGFVPSVWFPDDVPIEIWTGKRQDVLHLHPFGCNCWVTLPEVCKNGKLLRQAVKGRLLGFMGRRGYRIWIPDWGKIMESRDVCFEEGMGQRMANRGTVQLTGQESNNEVMLDQRPDLDSSNSGDVVMPRSQDSSPLSSPPDSPQTQNSPAPPPTTWNLWDRSNQGNLNVDGLIRRQMGWSNNSMEPEKTMLALLARNPWAFASSTTDTFIPKSYNQAMK